MLSERSLETFREFALKLRTRKLHSTVALSKNPRILPHLNSPKASLNMAPTELYEESFHISSKIKSVCVCVCVCVSLSIFTLGERDGRYREIGNTGIPTQEENRKQKTIRELVEAPCVQLTWISDVSGSPNVELDEIQNPAEKMKRFFRGFF
jgi:hypothetical protein